MPDLLSQIQNLSTKIPTPLFVFFAIVAGLIALMFVFVFLLLLWSIIRLIFGRRSSSPSLYNRKSNSAWWPNSPANPNSPNNPSSWNNVNNMNNPNNPFGWTNPNSPNNPNNWMHKR
jgi:hypothetical protein